MAISPEELQRHLDDYALVTGTRVEKFVCPITERLCEVAELMNGHILNEGITSASRETVIQYSKVDDFYGTRVEAGFVEFINTPKKSSADLLAAVSRVMLRFADGSELDGFFADETAAVRFPAMPISKDGKHVATVYIRTERDDPRLKETSVEVEWVRGFTNSHWTATLVKSAFLAQFRLLGYQAVRDPYGEFVRQTLHAYFRDKASRQEARRYFYPFRNAVKLALSPEGKPDPEGPDTLKDKTFIFHYTPSDLLFAITARFKMNDVFALVTLPGSVDWSRHVEVMRTYNRLMDDESSVEQYIRWAIMKDGTWHVEAAKRSIAYKAKD